MHVLLAEGRRFFGTLQAGAWSAAKGFYTGDEPFDPNHTTYNPDVPCSLATSLRRLSTSMVRGGNSIHSPRGSNTIHDTLTGAVCVPETPHEVQFSLFPKQKQSPHQDGQPATQRSRLPIDTL